MKLLSSTFVLSSTIYHFTCSFIPSIHPCFSYITFLPFSVSYPSFFRFHYPTFSLFIFCLYTRLFMYFYLSFFHSPFVLVTSLWSSCKRNFYPMLPGLVQNIAFRKVFRLLPFAHLERATCRWRWAWSTGGMILTGENRSTGRKACPSASVFTTNITWTYWNGTRSSAARVTKFM